MSNSAFVGPRDYKNLRACMVCGIVQTYAKFVSGGCPNCEAFLELTGSGDAVNECTSQVFDGLMTVADTKTSWVARYQRLEGYIAGVYAVQVEGVLPEEVVAAVEAAGVNYVPRDGSAEETISRD
ncbi:putative transcriptional elongation protein Spt4 [Lophium mytilinum]|uniref:Transcription elongation factor SPT4 n=1 Tax=Lophium mytilinum TaxID=390894 RepID=A0A6A6QJ93_9PEZI|nr:putative transcriptional elongation protein Spt4 [Lophium mytilinum]